MNRGVNVKPTGHLEKCEINQINYHICITITIINNNNNNFKAFFIYIGKVLEEKV